MQFRRFFFKNYFSQTQALLKNTDNTHRHLLPCEVNVSLSKTVLRFLMIQQNSVNSIVSDLNLSDDRHLSLEMDKMQSSPIIFKQNLDTSANQSNEYFRTLMIENRNQNSELRFMITNLANKIDLLMNRIDRNNLKYSDIQVDEIFSKLKQENSELKNQLQNIEMKSKQEIDQLKGEKNQLKKSEQKLKEIVNEQKTKSHENELLHLQNHELNEQNINLNEKISVLEETIYQQKVRISDLESQELFLKNHQGIHSEKLSKCHDHIKRLMDNCFREIRHSYQATHIYNGGDVISTIAPKIVKTTYDIIHSIDNELDSCIKDSSTS